MTNALSCSLSPAAVRLEVRKLEALTSDQKIILIVSISNFQGHFYFYSTREQLPAIWRQRQREKNFSGRARTTCAMPCGETSECPQFFQRLNTGRIRTANGNQPENSEF